jgi:hypothetical protein
MALFRDKEIFDYPFVGALTPQPFVYGTVCEFNIHGVRGKGTLEDFVQGQMPHKLKNGTIDPEKVRRRGSLVLLSMNQSDFIQIDYDCLYPCDSATTVLELHCVVQATPPRKAMATRGIDDAGSDAPEPESPATVAARKAFQREQLVRKFLEDLEALG